jgi:hypothetical protein
MTMAGKISSYFSTIPLPARHPASVTLSARGLSMITYRIPTSGGAIEICRRRCSASICMASTMTSRPSSRIFELAARTRWKMPAWLPGVSPSGVVSFLISSEETISTPCPADHPREIKSDSQRALASHWDRLTAGRRFPTFMEFLPDPKQLVVEYRRRRPPAEIQGVQQGDDVAEAFSSTCVGKTMDQVDSMSLRRVTLDG